MVLHKIKIKLTKSKIGLLAINILRVVFVYPAFYTRAILYYTVRNRIKKPEFYPVDVFFEKLENDKVSISRFGDGEIQWIFKDAKNFFGQENSDSLSNDLKNTLSLKRESLLVCIPKFFDEMNDYKKNRIISRNSHLYSNYKRWNSVIDENYTYGDALITRVYNGRKSVFYAKMLFDKWKNFFSNKNIIVIEGEKTRFGVNNDLLKSALSVRRIIGPSEGAYKFKDEIYSAIKSTYFEDSGNVLYLLCMGPVASILSAYISQDGYQSIDIGHLDIEYEWYLRNAKTKISIPGKYVNEVGGAPLVDIDCSHIERYKNEIIFVIGEH